MDQLKQPIITPANRTVQLAVRYATEAGLRPYTSLRSGGPGRPTYRGMVWIVLDGPGRESPFGAIVVGARSGKILRSVITYGNSGKAHRFGSVRELLTALRALAEKERPR